jgi:hypothetical protein
MYRAYPENLGLCPGDALKVDGVTDYFCCVESSPVEVPEGYIYAEISFGEGCMLPVATVQVFDGQTCRRLLENTGKK